VKIWLDKVGQYLDILMQIAKGFMSEAAKKPDQEESSDSARPVTSEERPEPIVHVGAPQPLTPEGVTIGSPLPIKENPEEPEELPGKGVAEAPAKKPYKYESDFEKELKTATDLQHILEAGKELLGRTRYPHITLREIGGALNRVGQSELAAQYLLKAEEVNAANEQTYYVKNLLAQIAELTNLLKSRPLT